MQNRMDKDKTKEFSLVAVFYQKKAGEAPAGFYLKHK